MCRSRTAVNEREQGHEEMRRERDDQQDQRQHPLHFDCDFQASTRGDHSHTQRQRKR